MIRQVDRYELLEQVGTGGMAAVYRGRDSALDREVAVKLLHPHLASRPDARARFYREARAVARLAHPNIVEIYDYAGDGAKEGYLVTEYVRGRTLRTFAESVGLEQPEIGALIGRALADALAHAHAAGVIHRDIKPENVLVCEVSGRRAVKLADFGIARILAFDDRMTMTGALVGSPNHMAPEIIEGREADARSDIFSLGTLLYWLTTGKLPFAAPNPTATLKRVVEGQYEDPRIVSPLVSDALAAVMQRALALDPAARYPTASAFRDALDDLLVDSGLTRPKEELEAFLDIPAAYKASLPKRLVATLTARGEEAARSGSSARAIAYFNRVLTLDPENLQVVGELRHLARRGRIRRLVVRGGAVVLLGTIGVVGVIVAPRASRQSPTLQENGHSPAVSVTPSPKLAVSPPVFVAPPPVTAPKETPAPRIDPDRPTTPARPPRSPPAAKPRTPVLRADAATASPRADEPKQDRRAPSTVEIAAHVRPYAQRALLDGVEVARGEQRVTFSLTPDRAHVILIEHACCAPFVKKIEASEIPELHELKVPLVPNPARLRVDADPDTRVYLDGEYLGTAGESQRSPLPVPVPGGSESPYEGRGHIRLEQPGKPSHTASVLIRAGGEITVAAPRAESTP